MTRRQLLGTVGAAVGAICAASLPDRRRKYGHLTVENCAAKGIDRRMVQVYLDGSRATDVVLEADDVRGFIVRHSRNEKGHLFADAATGYEDADGVWNVRLARERVYGDVEIRVKGNA